MSVPALASCLGGCADTLEMALGRKLIIRQNPNEPFASADQSQDRNLAMMAAIDLLAFGMKRITFSDGKASPFALAG
jgi:hypothetical protein